MGCEAQRSPTTIAIYRQASFPAPQVNRGHDVLKSIVGKAQQWISGVIHLSAFTFSPGYPYYCYAARDQISGGRVNPCSATGVQS